MNQYDPKNIDKALKRIEKSDTLKSIHRPDTNIMSFFNDIEKDNIDPVFAIMQHIGMSQGLDYRIIPSKQAKITANVRELSYDEVMA